MIGILEQGLIASLVAMGVFISFRVIDLPDLTPDGSYVLGGAVTVAFMYAGLPWILCMILGGIMAGFFGIITALIYNKLKVNVLLASILVMTMLYSINIRVMNGPNISTPKEIKSQQTAYYTEKTKLDDLLGMSTNKDSQQTIQNDENKRTLSPFRDNSGYNSTTLLLSIVLISFFITIIFLRTEFGIALRGYGSNKLGIKNLGINPEMMSIIGLFLGNFFAGISGSLFSMYAGFSDVNMGQGIVVTSLAAVILGEIIFGKMHLFYNMLCPLIGAVVYQFLLALAMRYGYVIGFQSSDMKLITSLFIIIVIGLRRVELKKWLSLRTSE
ncbi:ABC transporter permease [Petrotoga sp. 9PWA.NaAc.5.4]|nr:ABC transporter permease [Petrotoga sp. 9PWA.NaAc.5.4]